MSSITRRQIDLDLVRVLAMAMIFTFHYFLLMGEEYFHTWFIFIRNGGWGPIGTGIFFAMSGYLLQTHDRETETLAFWKKRFAQIIPMQILVFLPSYFYYAFLRGDLYYGGYIETMLYSFLGVDGYLNLYGRVTYFVTGEWYTAVILLLYLLFPLLRKLYEKHYKITTAVIVLLYLINIVHPIQQGVVADASVFSGLLMFWAGMSLHKVYSFTDAKTKRTKAAAVCAAVILVVLAFVPLIHFRSALYYCHLFGICLMVLLHSLFGLRSPGKSAGKALGFLSMIQFAFYLTHHYIIYRVLERYGEFIHRTRANTIAAYFAVMLLTFVVSIGYTYLWKLIRAGIKRCSASRV